jgi:hypothetical protein
MMHQKYWKALESSGLPPGVIENLKRAPRLNEVDRMFCDSAEKALAAAGYSALEFLAANPGASKVELARRLRGGCNTVGITMAIYEEAARTGIVREIAKALLVREIREAFPSGWDRTCGMKIWSWVNDIEKYVENAADNCYAERLIKDLAIDHPPPNRWKPTLEGDPLIDELFDHYWPTEMKE